LKTNKEILDKRKKLLINIPFRKDIYIYIISNPSFPGWYKVGRTNNPERRLLAYQTSDPLRSYKLEFVKKVIDISTHENAVYSKIENRGEWIKTELESLIKVIDIIEN